MGYELYCRLEYLLRLSESIESAGADLGYRLYGAQALLSMRLEKTWGVWGLEYRPDFNAVESGMDVSNDEAILKDGEAIGYVSSAGYAHRIRKSMAIGYISSEHAVEGTVVQIEILGEFYDSKILGAPAYDPTGALMRLA